MPEPLVGVAGLGRLGRAVLARCAADGLPTRPYDTRRPADWFGGPRPDVLVDCGAAACTGAVLDLCARLGVPLAECVSDLTPAHLDRLAELGRRTAVVRATNLALGHHLQARLLDELAAVLVAAERHGLADAVGELAVVERHPATKAHRPSATATALARRWEDATGRAPVDVASLRAGPPVSDHEVRLGWGAQSLVLRHEVRSLDAPAGGAVAVARWLATGRPPGLYAVSAVFDDLLAASDRPAAGRQDGGPVP